MDMNRAYVAGLIDGEGCIHIEIVRGLFFNPRVTVGMTEPALQLLQNLQAEWGGTLYQARKPTKKWAAAWAWHLTAEPAANLLMEIKPYLRLKHEQADIALEVWHVKQSLEKRKNGHRSWTEQARSRCRELVSRMHDLNRKGPQPDAESAVA